MLSRKTKYGIKALSFLAMQESNSPIQASLISKEKTISHKYLESILLELKKAGILGSKKGKGGGYYLLKPANEIIMVDVIRQLEGPIAMIPCVSLNFYETCQDCPNEKNCEVHKIMEQVRDATLNILKNTSLSDLVNNTKIT